MANRSYLITGETEDFDINVIDHDEDIIAAANYSVPLLWLALFDEKDLLLTEMEMADGATVYCPRLAAKTEKCKDVFTERRRVLLSLLPDDFHDLFEIYAKYILCIGKPYLHIELSEIWTMASDIPLFENNLRRALRSMNRLDLQIYTQTLKDISIIDFDADDGKKIIKSPKSYDEITALLCGYSWYKKLPWN
jgi:hypothetical protein